MERVTSRQPGDEAIDSDDLASEALQKVMSSEEGKYYMNRLPHYIRYQDALDVEQLHRNGPFAR